MSTLSVPGSSSFSCCGLHTHSVFCPWTPSAVAANKKVSMTGVSLKFDGKTFNIRYFFPLLCKVQWINGNTLKSYEIRF